MKRFFNQAIIDEYFKVWLEFKECAFKDWFGGWLGEVLFIVGSRRVYISSTLSFKAFADLCVKRQIMTAIKSSTRQKHIPLNSYLSLNKTAFDDEDDRSVIEMLDMETVPDPLETITTAETYKKLEMKMSEVLSDFEQRVLSRYLEGESYSQIASSLDSHVKAVDNAVQRIKKKACKYIQEDMWFKKYIAKGKYNIFTMSY